MKTISTGQDAVMEQAEPQIVNSIAPAPPPRMTLAEVRAKLEGKTGKRYWKSMDELADTPQFQELMQEEFPRQSGAGEWVDAVSRRGFLKVMGASFALAGLAGCTKQPDEEIYPYVKQPEDLVLGKPMYFATAHPFPTGAIPVLVKSDAFRPIKIEGNPEHPMSKGKSDAYTQATLLDLYDPDRSKGVVYRGSDSQWGRFQQEFGNAMKATGTGDGVYFLSEASTSPSLGAQWKQVQAKYPAAKLVVYEPVGGGDAGTQAAFGEAMSVQYKLEDADVILALDADFLGGIAFPGFLPMSAAYAERHRYEEGKTMNRMYVVESMPTVTGYKAEHRLALKPSEIDAFASGLAGGAAGSLNQPEAQKFMASVLDDLKKSGGRCVVIAGPTASPAVQAAAHALNASLGSAGKTVVYGASIQALESTPGADMKSLVADMNAGKVKWLVMMGVNPVYTAPADLNFTAALTRVPVTAHLGSYLDETGFVCTWHINQAHYLESWSDARAIDGTVSIIQPMIEPLYKGVSAHDVLQAVLDPSLSGYDVVVANAKTYLAGGAGTGDFATGWRKALHDGWVEGTAGTAKTPGAPRTAPGAAAAAAVGGGLEVAFKHDPSLYDGRYSNNGWLQELPKQVTSLSWDNAALVSLNTMTKFKLEENMAVELELNGRKVVAPVLMVPGHPDDCVTVYLGHGRRGGDGLRVGQGVGFDAYTLRTADSPASASGLSIKPLKETYDLCVTKVHTLETRGAYAQHDLTKKLSNKEGAYSLAGHEAMERAIIRYATVAEVKANPGFAKGEAPRESTGKEEVFNPLGGAAQARNQHVPGCVAL